MCGRRVPFVPGSRCGGAERPPPSGDRWLRPVDPNRLLPGTRCGGVGLTEDLSLALDVIPQDKTIEIVAAGEEHPPLGLLGHAVRKADVFLGL